LNVSIHWPNNVSNIFLLIIPLILSAFTNLWNPIGFPSFLVDEGIYMGRAMHILEGNGPVEDTGLRSNYDHPFFGQIFLAAALGLIGYPDSLQPSADGADGVLHSIETLYLAPRVLMGLLAVVDTFLIYKIAERRYNNRTIAFIASILFAVMPLTWLLRRIFLDNLLIPLLLASILFALLYVRTPRQQNKYNNDSNSSNKKNIIAITLSGVFLGLSILTKIPAFTFIPLVGFIVITNSNRNWKILGLWFIPVILIPAIWPVYSITAGEFDDWVYGVEFQSRREGKPLVGAMEFFLTSDPLLLLLGVAGLIFAAIKKDFFILLWALPFLAFLYFLSWVSYFHLAPIIPIFCLAAGVLLAELFNKISKKKIIQRLSLYIVIGAIGIFGLASTWALITTNVTYGYFQIYSSVVNHLTDYNDAADTDGFLLTGSYWTEAFVWIPKYIFHKDIQFIKEREGSIVDELDENKKFILLVDRNIFKNVVSRTNEKLAILYAYTKPFVNIDDKAVKYDHSSYPYSNMEFNRDSGRVQVRSNF
jgi:hypothetical protein